MDFLEFNKKIIAEFRENDGKCGGPFEGMDMLLLTMKGAKSGRELISPLVHSTDDDGNHIIIASKGGAPENPNWYHNLIANPEVTVEVAGDSYQARAELTEDDDRQALYDAQAEQMPQFAEYATKAGEAGRTIPVFRLQRS